MGAHVVDMGGKKYGRVTALMAVGVNRSRGMVWLCRCDCGKDFNGTGSEIRYGRITSCPTCAAKNKLDGVTTHGLTKHPIYHIWLAIKRRCENPRAKGFDNYGGRGIVVCDRWRASFVDFLADMGNRPTPMYTIERNDTNGNYEPSNCRWATRLEQANNKRNNKKIVIGGVSKNLCEWARHAGVNESAIRNRLKRGLTGESLITPSAFRTTKGVSSCK